MIFKLPTVSLLTMVLGLCLVFADPAQAHKVNIFAYVEGGHVYTESYFADGRPVEKGTVEVYDQTGNKLLTGKTDRSGLFSFPFSKIAELTIIINAGLGHKNKFLLKRSEME